ncbi:MAG: c-type cytochrome [Anaerolineae bacterium]|jgi:mono/diheme cytochrome c family protein|nr:c-type cytochrome [Anaerolineae bacterium]
MTEQVSSETPPKKPMSSLPILIGLGLIIGFGAIFLFEFLQLSRPSGGLEDENVTADAYLADVTPLLENADPERGRQLLSSKGCIGCHANNLAPSYVETHEQAANRRPPMTAQGYLYESIVFPNAFMVGDYPTNMPMNYVDSLTTAEIGDIIAYLLSPLAATP